MTPVSPRWSQLASSWPLRRTSAFACDGKYRRYVGPTNHGANVWPRSANPSRPGNVVRVSVLPDARNVHGVVPKFGPSTRNSPLWKYPCALTGIGLVPSVDSSAGFAGFEMSHV